jgi:hypothetical protein
LFAEPKARQVELIEHSALAQQANDDVLFIRVPRENALNLTLKQLKRLVKPKLAKRDRTKVCSRARYKVATKPVLASLHMHLQVWDARRANPDATLDELADIAEVSYNHKVNGETLASLKARDLPDADVRKVLKRRKELVVKRHLRIAEQYIANVAERETFPLRSSR